MSPQTYALLADIIAFIHGLVIVFFASAVIISLVLKKEIPDLYNWLLGIVAIPSLVAFIINRDCPLTMLEYYCRGRAGQDVFQASFIAHYLQSFLKIEIGYVFVGLLDLAAGIIVGLIVLLTLTRRWPRNT